MGEGKAKNPLRIGLEVEMVEPRPSGMVDTNPEGQNVFKPSPLACSLVWGVKSWQLLGTIRWFTQLPQFLQTLNLRERVIRTLAVVGIGGS